MTGLDFRNFKLADCGVAATIVFNGEGIGTVYEKRCASGARLIVGEHASTHSTVEKCIDEALKLHRLALRRELRALDCLLVNRRNAERQHSDAPSESQWAPTEPERQLSARSP